MTITYREFEELCRKVFSKKYNIELEERIFSDRIPKKFDMVSSDKTVVGDAKFLTMVRGKKTPPAKLSNIFEYVYLLEKTPAKIKFMVFGNDKRVPNLWLKRYGHLLKEIQFFFLDWKTGILENLKDQVLQ